MERRRGADVPVTGDRRRGDRRQGQAAVLRFRRATDRRLDDGQAAALLQRRALDQRVRRAELEVLRLPRQRETVVLDTVVDLDERPSAHCPECGVAIDPLWLVRHYVEAHPTWP